MPLCVRVASPFPQDGIIQPKARGWGPDDTVAVSSTNGGPTAQSAQNTLSSAGLGARGEDSRRQRWPRLQDT